MGLGTVVLGRGKERTMGDCWPESDTVHAWVADHGLQDRVSNEDMHALAEKVTEERLRLQKQIDSIAMMLGWGNTPPAKSLEDTIRAMKERGRLTEDELQEARLELHDLKKGWRIRLQQWAALLGLPEPMDHSYYEHRTVARRIALWREVMEFYALVGTWQGNKEGHEESACEREIGAKARAALGRPDRDVPEEDDDEVLDNGMRKEAEGKLDVRGTTTGRIQSSEPNEASPGGQVKTCDTCGNRKPQTGPAYVPTSPMPDGFYCGNGTFHTCAGLGSFEDWVPEESKEETSG
jgi:hypothetical protein